jgi:hypothetical protein
MLAEVELDVMSASATTAEPPIVVEAGKAALGALLKSTATFVFKPLLETTGSALSTHIFLFVVDIKENSFN